MTTRCSDCKGSGEYLPLIGLGEPCRLCKGRGELNDDGTAIDPKAKTLDSVFNANLPTWMEDHKDEIDLNGVVKEFVDKLDEDPDSGWSKVKGSNEQLEGLGRNTPSLRIGDTIHIYDAGWYEATVTIFFLDQNNDQAVRADTLYDSFRIRKTFLTYNVTQKRWEYIKAGTPVWP